MKHLPNLLTLANLVCGCIAIAYILTAMPYYTFKTNPFGPPTYEWVFGVQQLYLGSLFIGLGAICDFFDGFVARSLKIFSPMGKDLDSLADLVTFGVAPSFIIFQMLWDAQMAEKNVFDVNMLSMIPAFLIACFVALRLAKFNVSGNTQKHYFLGLPSPAMGLFVACFPLILWNNPFGIATYFKNKWVLYGIILSLSFLLVSKIKFFKFLPVKWQFKYFLPHLILLIGSIIGLIFLQILVLPLVFILYITISIFYKFPAEKILESD